MIENMGTEVVVKLVNGKEVVEPRDEILINDRTNIRKFTTFYEKNGFKALVADDDKHTQLMYFDIMEM